MKREEVSDDELIGLLLKFASLEEDIDILHSLSDEHSFAAYFVYMCDMFKLIYDELSIRGYDVENVLQRTQE